MGGQQYPSGGYPQSNAVYPNGPQNSQYTVTVPNSQAPPPYPPNLNAPQYTVPENSNDSRNYGYGIKPNDQYSPPGPKVVQVLPVPQAQPMMYANSSNAAIAQQYREACKSLPFIDSNFVI